MIGTKRIFVSYDYTRDHDLKGNFILQATTRGLPIVIEDYSLVENHRDPEWEKKARRQINRCSLVVVLIGPDTHNSSGVRKEIAIAREYKKPVIQIRPQKRPYEGVKGLRKPYPWKWKILDQVLISY